MMSPKRSGDDVADIALPDSLRYLEEEIAASRSLLDLEDDWDGEGSPGYQESTWRRAVEFLVATANRLRHERGFKVPAPEILPGHGGSLDLDWRTSGYCLLVNVPADPAAPIRSAGNDGRGAELIEGAIAGPGDAERFHALLVR